MHTLHSFGKIPWSDMAGPLFREEGKIQGARDRWKKNKRKLDFQAWWDGDSPEREGVLVLILSLTADSPRRMPQQIEEKGWILGSFHSSTFLHSVPALCFFCLQDFCFAFSSNAAHLFQWSLLRSCSANSYLNAANGLQAVALGREEVGHKHLQMKRERQTLRTSGLSPTGSVPCHSSLGIWCRKVTLLGVFSCSSSSSGSCPR